MPKIMKSLNAISRCQAAYRGAKLPELAPCHHAFVYAVCKEPGKSQEDIARALAVNKSTAARALSKLEEAGYVKRVPNPGDRRELLVYPTEKMSALLEDVRGISAEWNAIISADVTDSEMAVFESVVAKMEKSARAAAEAVAEGKG